MKITFAIAAVVAMLSLDSAAAMKSYLKKFPNGDAAFTQSLGHVSDSDTGLNDFGKLYSKSGGDWSKMCKEKFPGADMTCGEAFGDPCCKWTSGAADQKVDAFVKPTKKTTCAANAPAPAPAPADKPATTPAPAPAPAAGTDKPLLPGVTKPADKPLLPGATKPADKPLLPGKPNPKCGVKKEAKRLEDDEEESEIGGESNREGESENEAESDSDN